MKKTGKTRDSSVHRAVRVPSVHEERLALHLRAAKLQFEREMMPFWPARKFRFDFLVWREESNRVLVEVEGAIWVKGGHSSGTGITRDIEKSNLCSIHRLRLLRFTGEMIQSGKALRDIEDALSR